MSGKTFLFFTFILLVFVVAMMVDYIGIVDVFDFVEPSETFWDDLITKMAENITSADILD